MTIRVSEHETPATILIKEHYRKNGLDKGWNNERVAKLCEWLQVTPHELGALCCVEFKRMTWLIRRDHFPPEIALHFALLENFYIETVLKMKSEPVMPVNLIARRQ